MGSGFFSGRTAHTVLLRLVESSFVLRHSVIQDQISYVRKKSIPNIFSLGNKIIIHPHQNNKRFCQMVILKFNKKGAAPLYQHHAYTTNRQYIGKTLQKQYTAEHVSNRHA